MKTIGAIILILLSCTCFSQQPAVVSTRTGQVKFFSSTPAEDIEAVNNEVSSKFNTQNGQIVFTVLIKGFRFRNALMQEHFNENYMESARFPKADFKGSITSFQAVNMGQNGTYPVTVKGDITIHGVTQPLTASGTLEVRNGKVSVTGEFYITLKDFNIKGMAIGNQVAKQVKVTLQCQYL